MFSTKLASRDCRHASCRRLTVTRTLVLVVFVIAAPVCADSQEKGNAADRVTVPLLIERNRPFVDVVFRRPDGSTRSARFLVDTGGGGFLITEFDDDIADRRIARRQRAQGFSGRA